MVVACHVAVVGEVLQLKVSTPGHHGLIERDLVPAKGMTDWRVMVQGVYLLQAVSIRGEQ